MGNIQDTEQTEGGITLDLCCHSVYLQKRLLLQLVNSVT